MTREDIIRKRADEIFERNGRRAGGEQKAWDEAIQEVEREGSEESRGPARPGPRVGGKNALPMRDEKK